MIDRHGHLEILGELRPDGEVLVVLEEPRARRRFLELADHWQAQ
jgi:hypothetical protein